MKRLKQWAKQMKQQLTVLYFAAQHPDMPLMTKLFAVFIVSYALSPIDLIPDFIPVLGILDDLILLPLGIYLCYKMIPEQVLIEAKKQAETEQIDKKHTSFIVVLIVLFWIAILWTVIQYLLPYIIKK
ncbi:DUF1232 domain-containing protein [Macrococcus brunensis]|uniref:DUF1232 domain-containing protein n=1 Tax=Macrococcus brunensis TaxID=198483 RepID=A0A4R6BGI4_9STAP|nr:DUF1232 domain-containing protein [Macrococcus brunensis]TDL99014.1 DUF1232 domain-containing protein [Macrococcus brunensis]ULG72454.1 DUF1232 domain-containing protein [Macrococcus brunensis]ULG74709.1 DUF1232 domain-containing protein [Macrococcus brunensis]